MDISESSKVQYLKRMSQFTKRTIRESGKNKVKPSEIVECLMLHKNEYKKASIRQYKAALNYCFNEQLEPVRGETDDLIEAIDMLTKISPPENQTIELETSAQNLKNISKIDLILLISYLKQKKPRYYQETVSWLLSSMLTGLRPIEWKNASISESFELKCLNAKATQGRAHGEFRHINLVQLSEIRLKVIISHLNHVQKTKHVLAKNGKSGFEHLYERCRSCLYYATRKIWPKRKKHITLYSARHQFAADAKANGATLNEIAALMGHASIDTATRHYGKKSCGRRGFQVSANSEEVARVKSLNQHRIDYHQRVDSNRSTMSM